MTHTVGISPKYLEKLSDRQRKFILTAVGRKFYEEYLCRKGNHTYIIGNTGGGKTQRNYWLADWLRHTENIIWISSGKSDEILPLLFLGANVRIVIPDNAEFEIEGIENAPVQPNIVKVRSAGEAWHAVLHGFDANRNRRFNQITIFEFRQTLSLDVRAKWMTELFRCLAEWTLDQTMPAIFPCAIFIDESQWVLAGTRITTEQERTKASEVITENVLEMRSRGCRVVFSAQSQKNVTPASRENMLNAILCRGANVTSDENAAWATACRNDRSGVRATSTFSRDQARFVFDDGRFYPNEPWKFPLFPLSEEDREKMGGMAVRYGRKSTGKTEEEKEQEELIPELGRFSALAIPPEKEEPLGIDRYNCPEVVDEQ